ncbi:MAG: rod shape-determining protein MreD [Eggerthellaceae bacterium]|nr:rod shape-determining protein MreD [Eggerthellaceae bacterium]
MTDGREHVALVIGALIALVLQLAASPALAVGPAQPNFLAAYCVAVAVARPRSCGPVLPFVLGLAYDLAGGGPVGAMAFVLVLVTFVASRAMEALNNDTLFMPLAILVASLLSVELLYGALCLACGAGGSLADALAYRALPCALYDCVAGLVAYPLAARFLAGRPLRHPGSPQLR